MPVVLMSWDEVPSNTVQDTKDGLKVSWKWWVEVPETQCKIPMVDGKYLGSG